MRYTLFLIGSLLTALLSAQLAGAQSLAAGQAAGAVYTDLVPDKVIGQSATGTLDLDNDGRADLQLTAYYYASAPTNFPSTAETRVLMLHEDVNLRTITQAPTLVALNSGDVVQDQMPPNPNPQNQASYELWTGPSTVYPYVPTFLSSYRNNPAGQQSYGYWLDKQDHYLAVRLRASATAAWRYGWVRVQVPDYNAAIITVKDYAFTSATLGTQPAQAAGWQVYPTCVTNYLTLVPPTATAAQLTVSDLCGRVQLRAALAPAGSQLDLSALAAGVYVVRLDTPAGSFSQRISKY